MFDAGLQFGQFRCGFCCRKCVFFSPHILTYNLIWRRCARYVAFHLASLPSHCVLDWIAGDDGRTCSGQKKGQETCLCAKEWNTLKDTRFPCFLYQASTGGFWNFRNINNHHFCTCSFLFFFNSWQADLLESARYLSGSSNTLNCVEVFWPLTVSVTSVSPTPIRGTMALHTYWPASAWLTDFRYSWLLLLRTCGGVEKKAHKYKQCKSAKQQ